MIKVIKVSLVGKIDGKDEFSHLIESWDTYGMPIKRVMDAAESFRDYWYSERDYLQYSFVNAPYAVVSDGTPLGELFARAEWVVRVTLVGPRLNPIESMESDPFEFGKSEVASIYGE